MLFGDWMRQTFLKPPKPGTEVQAAPAARPVEELEATVRSADDKERLIGLIAAPIAAAIGILVITALVANDPPAYKDGHANKLHVSVSLYHELTLVLLALSVLILLTSLLRKRLFIGITLALFGLAIFNLHYWGFGIPFVLAGAWYLVRAYRVQRELKEATGDVPARGSSAFSGRPRQNKRYTPPASRGRTRAVQGRSG